MSPLIYCDSITVIKKIYIVSDNRFVSKQINNFQLGYLSFVNFLSVLLTSECHVSKHAMLLVKFDMNLR